MHVFKYSRRKGTVADKMDGQIPENIKSARSDELLELDKELSYEYRKQYIGKTVEILLEEEIIIDNKPYFVGFTDTYVKVMVENKDNKFLSNEIISVKIKDIIGKDMVNLVAEI